MLSVFITPWTKPTDSHRAIRARLPLDDAFEQCGIRSVGCRKVRIESSRSRSRQGGGRHLRRSGGRNTGRCRREHGSLRHGSIRRPAEAAHAVPSRRWRPLRATASLECRRAAIASLTRYSRSTGPTAALPSPRREKTVRPEPFSCRSKTSAITGNHLAEQYRTTRRQAPERNDQTEWPA